MASTALPGVTQPQPHSSPSSDQPLSWEGDRMFNIYIYDYCYKRGFKKTARELLQEAEIPADSKPPINARQGLLFEWWSVFWVLFTAKANGMGSEDAMLYTQYQTNQRQMQQHRMQPPAQVPLPGAPIGQPGGPQQPPVPRILNGPMAQRLGPPFPMNGPMPNGVHSGQMPPGPGSFPNLGGPGPQPNGIPGSGPPQNHGATPPQHQAFQSLRPLGGPSGHQQSPQPPPQQRQNGPFQPSPTMANSPQAGAPGQGQQPQQTTPQQQPQQPPQPHGQPPMGQLGAPGPSPRLQHLNNRAMQPPQGLNPLVQQPGNAPNPPFPQPGPRPPSRTNTPGGQSNMMQPSPSLSARQPPGSAMMQVNPEMITMELRQIPHPLLMAVKSELGWAERDISQLSLQDKGRLLAQYRARLQKPDGPGHPGGLQLPNAQLRVMHQQQPQQQAQPRLKRSSTTPEEQHEGGRNDSSPPQKRQRPSPEQLPMQGMPFPQRSQQLQGLPSSGPQPGQPGMPMPGQNPLMMMRPNQIGSPMSGAMPQGGQPPMGNPINMNLGQPPMGGPPLGGVALNPQHPGGHPGQPGLINPQPQWQQQQPQYRQMPNMPGLKGPLPPQGMNPTIQGPSNNQAPIATDPALHPGAPGAPGGPQFNRLQPQNKPMGMMPPPSPAQNGGNKDQGGSKDIKLEDTGRGNSGQTPNAGGTGPSTPAPGVTGTNAPGLQVPPPTTNGAPNTGIAPSPSMPGAPLNPGPMANQQSVLSDTAFLPDFMQHLSNSLNDFDPNIFPNDGDINFERDFGQWFNGDDVTLDMK